MNSDLKPKDSPTSNIPYSQSLWHVEELGGLGPSITLKYTGSQDTLVVHTQVQLIDPYYQYATLEFCSDPIATPYSICKYIFSFF
jgi:hypothetical protein